LFQLAIGGYGLFGIISRVRLRLQRRRKLRRLVMVVEAEAVTTAFAERIREGCLYGDFQFSIDEQSPHFLRRGVFSCYEPVDDDTPISVQRQLSSDDWLNLLHLAHTDRAEGFRRYTAHYLASHGQTYWSDTHQLSPYLPDYSQLLRGDRGADANGRSQRSSLVISELYVPRQLLASFLRESAQILRAARVPVIYGTVRLIERDDESALPWAREAYASIIFNLLTPHTPTDKPRRREFSWTSSTSRPPWGAAFTSPTTATPTGPASSGVTQGSSTSCARRISTTHSRYSKVIGGDGIGTPPPR
jgi:FAD/FMN-containing dehydrogenase